MAAIFAMAKTTLYAAEGGAIDSPNDYGGFTKLGVSQASYPQLNIAALNDEQLFNIIEQDYWVHYRLSEIENQTIANQALLLFVNMNPISACKILQAAAIGCGRGFIALKLDGVMGSETFRSLNSLSPFWLSDRIRMEAAKYYLGRTDEDHTQIPNLRSWIRRILL